MTRESQATQVAVLAEQVKNIDSNVRIIREALEKEYVTRNEFDPIKKIVYGFVGLALTAVAGGLIALVVIPK